MSLFLLFIILSGVFIGHGLALFRRRLAILIGLGLTTLLWIQNPILSFRLMGIGGGLTMLFLGYFVHRRKISQEIKNNPFKTEANHKQPVLTPPPVYSIPNSPIPLTQVGTQVTLIDKEIEKDGFPQSFIWCVNPQEKLSLSKRLFYKIFDPISFSLFLGSFFKTSFSRILIPFFIKRNQIQIDRFEGRGEKGSFLSFDDFFTRRLKNPVSFFVGAAPCEGEVVYVSRASTDQVLTIKGEKILVSDLVGKKAAKYLPEFIGVIITYLCPKDYHLGASPFEGKIIHKERISGLAWTVHPQIWNEKNIEGKPGSHYLLFNTRDVLVKQTEYGAFFTIYVAATNVFSTEIHPRVGDLVSAGEHEQTYHLGSTNVYLFDASKFYFPQNLFPQSCLKFGKSSFLISRQNFSS